MQVYSKKQAQIKALLFDEALTKVPAKYSNYSNVFSMGNIVELPKNTRMNKYAIKLEKSKQPLFGLIYNLKPVELKTLKNYIKTNLANGFIRLSKSPAKAPIFFNKKPNKNLCLCVDYWGLNNIIIKNQYPLPLIGKLLDWFGQAKRFTQLDLINTNYWMRICKNDE